MESTFRFLLRTPQELPPGPTALEAFMRQQIEALLDIVVLTADGKPVEVDGFIWAKDAFRPTIEEPQSPVPLNADGRDKGRG